MAHTLLIGFGHRARNGKDTAAAHIIRTFKDRFDIRRYGFADELKAELSQLDQFGLCMKHGVPYDFDPDINDSLCTSKHGKQAALLQFWGMHRRSQDPFYWVNKLDKKI